MAESTYVEIKKETQLANEENLKEAATLTNNTTANNTTSSNNNQGEEIEFLGVKFIIPSMISSISNDISMAGKRIDCVIVDEVRFI